MSDLREDLDRALRTVTFGEAPVEQARRQGRRIRARRRAALAAATLAVAAIAAGYPALTRSGAPARHAPLNGNQTPAPRQASYGGDPVLRDGPSLTATRAPGGMTDQAGRIAQGTVGPVTWRLTVRGTGPASSCYTVTLSAPGGRSGCAPLPDALASGLSSGDPAKFTGAEVREGADEAMIGVVAGDVTYLIVTFHDGQRLKLIPVTAYGRRYIGWVAPMYMTVDSVVAHLGGPYSDGGRRATAIPFNPAGQLPLFGLWQKSGQAAPPRASRIIAGGTGWAAFGEEGPWGTCFTAEPGFGDFCVPSGKLDTTAILGSVADTSASRGGVGGDRPRLELGSAAPGVASVRVTLSNGTTATVRPADVGNERLFAFAVGKGVTLVGWSAYDASGKQVGRGASAPTSAGP